MKLHQLQALVGAVAHGSIRAAARDMNLTQAALTKALRLLEEECGVPLLLRRSRGVVLTPAGQHLHARACLITRQIVLAEDELQQLQGGNSGTVFAALTPYLMFTVLGEAFLWFRKKFPRTEIRIMEGLVTRVLPAIRDGSIDFAIVADSGDIPRSEYLCTALNSEKQKIVVRMGHPLLENPTVARVAAMEWVVTGPFTQGIDVELFAMFAQAKVAPPTLITRCDAMAAMALLRQSDAVSLMPETLLRQPECNGLVELNVPRLHPPEASLVFVAPPDVPLTPAAAYLARCLTDAIAGRTQA